MNDIGKIEFKLEYENPIDLQDFSNALGAFGREYKRHLSISDDKLSEEEVSLHISKIREGSIVAELIALAPYALPFLESANTIVTFCQNFGTTFKYLSTLRGEKPEFTKEQLENYESILRPSVRDSGTQINISGGTFNGDVIVNPVIVRLGNMDCRAAFQSAQNILQELNRKRSGLHEKVVLSWYQARNDPKSKAGDRSIIESIYSGSVKTIFLNESIKAKMIGVEENLFNLGYLVDVMVETIRDKPVLYRILECYETVS